MKVPDDIHENVLDLAVGLVNASAAGDTRTKWRLHGELRDYCESTAEAGRDHPFLWETLGDFTTDNRAAIGFYLRALSQAKHLNAPEFQASICFALAERHLELGAPSKAYDYAFQANELAMLSDDLDLRRGISQFLLDLSSRTSVGSA